MAEPLLDVVLVGTGGAYAWASARSSLRFGQAVVFFAGLAVVAAALTSPLDGAAGRHLTAHMVQHLLLVSVAAPLLVAGRPYDVLTSAVRRRRTWPALDRPTAPAVVAAAVLQVGTLVLWHLPVLYDAALRHEAVHALEHVAITATAVALWFVLTRVDGEAAGAAVIAVFVATLPTMALGVAMTISRTPWYAYYATTAAPLADQQLAGVVMWAYGGLASLAAAIALFAAWMRRLERDSPGAVRAC
jgi:putative membrane protein